MSRFNIVQGNCLDTLRLLPDNSVDSVVTDPPYGLSFMGKKWDYDVPSTEIWAECLRVLKPGGHLLAFAGTRTQHRMAVRIEDAGFHIRDIIMWVYGCLDARTEVATKEGVKPYHSTKVGDLVLCYDVATGAYSYQPILELVEYDYEDTAYRLVGDFGEQIVSRNHRCIVERDGRESFVLAEEASREQQARVPILESLPDLRDALSGVHKGAGPAQKNVQQCLYVRTDVAEQTGTSPVGDPKGSCSDVQCLRCRSVETRRLVEEGCATFVQQSMQRETSGTGVETPWAQGACSMDTGAGGVFAYKDVGSRQPCMEGGTHLSQPKRCLCEPADMLCTLPGGLQVDGPQGRVCDGTQIGGGAGVRPATDADRVCASHQSRCDRQSPCKPDCVQDQRGAQEIRAWRGHRTVVVRIEPFRYKGKVWCLRVPTGAFVAVRDGVAFPTGNSGFPKSQDVSKAIDKAAGAEREVVGVNPNHRAVSGVGYEGVYAGGNTGSRNLTAPATDAAKQWQGWGTALKPSCEPITVARKPLIGTVAANVLEYGTGGINIDGCRVESGGEHMRGVIKSRNTGGWAASKGMHTPGRGFVATDHPGGRWPANMIHDGSDEIADMLTQERARFFYSPKANKADRGKDNPHPTVKPTDLMRYLCRLVTPPGGLVLDPFCGSGSTGKAALLEGFEFLGCELDPAYVEIANRRLTEVL